VATLPPPRRAARAGRVLQGGHRRPLCGGRRPQGAPDRGTPPHRPRAPRARAAATWAAVAARAVERPPAAHGGCLGAHSGRHGPGLAGVARAAVPVGRRARAPAPRRRQRAPASLSMPTRRDGARIRTGGPRRGPRRRRWPRGPTGRGAPARRRCAARRPWAARAAASQPQPPRRADCARRVPQGDHHRPAGGGWLSRGAPDGGAPPRCPRGRERAATRHATGGARTVERPPAARGARQWALVRREPPPQRRSPLGTTGVVLPLVLLPPLFPRPPPHSGTAAAVSVPRGSPGTPPSPTRACRRRRSTCGAAPTPPPPSVVAQISPPCTAAASTPRRRTGRPRRQAPVRTITPTRRRRPLRQSS